jgi:magnesium-protoporphyrin O-methyltransferase
MPSCCPCFGNAAEGQFTATIAGRDLRRYRRKGPGTTTRLLRDGIAASGAHALLLDIGSGIGSLAFELLDRGVARAIVVDASSSYLAAAREEAQRRGRSDAVEFIHGDFLRVGPDLPIANVVTLDRVVCCYPHVEALLQEALRHSRDRFGFSYPRDVWHVRAALAIENGMRRVRRNPFRSFVHSATVMEDIVTRAGFALLSRRESRVWSSDVYVRQAG